MTAISLEDVNKIYPRSESHAVRDLNLSVDEGELMVLVGPSGCGKTTALRMVAGLEDISSGTLRIDGRVANDTSPRERDIAMVFQNYALYPHMTVADNIAFTLKLRGVPKAEVATKVSSVASILHLSELLDRKPGQLSGGQRQRVAMGRAMVREPAVFLMDEPLSNLDAKLRVQMRAEVLRIQRHVGVATLYVTHDQVEAMTMGDRVAVLRSGVLQQCDTPARLYDRPVNMFVAAFIGSPAMNLYEAQLAADGETILLGSQQLELPASLITRAGLAPFYGSKLVVGLRPEHLAIADTTTGPQLSGDVDVVEALGSEQLVHFTLDAKRVRAEGAADEEESALVEGGQGVARIGPKTAIRPGERVRFAIDTDGIQFFDPANGENLFVRAERMDGEPPPARTGSPAQPTAV